MKVEPESLHATSAEWHRLGMTLSEQQLPAVGLSGSWASASAIEAVHSATNSAGQVLGARVKDSAAATASAATAYVRQESESAGELGGARM